MSTTEAIDKAWGWHRLPLPLALAVLEGIRMRMRQKNLYDPATTAYDREMDPAAPEDDRYLTRRTADGTYSDLRDPAMGSVEMRFGRNVPLSQTYPQAGAELLEPNLRTISNDLLARDAFIPATSLNLTAAAWLQFMVHDWLSHGQNFQGAPVRDSHDGPTIISYGEYERSSWAFPDAHSSLKCQHPEVGTETPSG